MIKVQLPEHDWIIRIVLILVIVTERSSSSIVAKEGLGSLYKVRRIKVLLKLYKYNILFACKLISLNRIKDTYLPGSKRELIIFLGIN